MAKSPVTQGAHGVVNDEQVEPMSEEVRAASKEVGADRRSDLRAESKKSLDEASMQGTHAT